LPPALVPIAEPHLVEEELPVLAEAVVVSAAVGLLAEVLLPAVAVLVAVEQGSDWPVESIPLEHFERRSIAVDNCSMLHIADAYTSIDPVVMDRHCASY